MQNYKELVSVTRDALQRHYYSKNEIPEDEDIYKWIDKSASFTDHDLPNKDRTDIFDLLKKEATSFVPPPIVLGKGRKRWMHERTDEQKEDYYSDKYKKHLLNKGEIPATEIHKIFKESDEILDLLENPLSRDGFKRKGLVMGDVQSGKTANYIGLINRAADVKYKLIILIAGLHVNLRRQTQNRAIEGFIGEDSITKEKIGVGKIAPIDRSRTPVSFTSLDNDFTLQTQKSITFNPESSNAPVVLVIKKNTSTLKSIIKWLQAGVGANQYTNNYPLLLIDDEADNASVNYNDEDADPTKINGQIREILSLFNKSSYVGYTATPFANIFIDPDSNNADFGDDLYPDDFIISLESPPSYIGPNYCFLDELTTKSVVREIKDNKECIPVPQPKEFSITKLPSSCKKSIEMFLLSIAIKIKRNTAQKHTSMLINITHKTDLQAEIEILVSNHLKYLLRAIRFERNNNSELSPELNQLQKIWIDEYKSEGNFDDLLSVIDSVSGSIVVKLINSNTTEVLNYSDYEQGLHAIVVGGFSLSRGFTFEGLTVSYLLRNSMMSDTVLQMGRWFGYRKGYEDLCRIFLLPISYVWYRHIATVIEELRQEIKIAKAYDLTPREYRMRIKNHPGKLLVTAKNKMRKGNVVRDVIDFSASLFETNSLSIKSEIVQKNRNCIDSFLLNLGSPVEDNKGYLWSGVENHKILELLVSFDSPPDYPAAQSVKAYIDLGAEEELSQWDVLITKEGTSSEYQIADKFKINKQRRSFKVPPTKNNCISFDDGGARIVRFYDEKAGLTEVEFERAEKDRIDADIKQTAKFYRIYRNRPLLVLKVLDISYDGGSVASVYAYGISFPICNTYRAVEYVYPKKAILNQT